MKKIAFFQSDLGVGGIQKSLLNLLRNLDYDRFRVDLYLTEQRAFWNDSLPDQLRLFDLKPISRAYSFLPISCALNRVRYDFPRGTVYDLAVDFNSYQCSCAVGALTVPARKRVMWIHNDVRIKLENEWKYRVLWHFFRGKFPYYDAFIPVSEALIEPFQSMSGARNKPFFVIPNYIDVQEIRRKMEEVPSNLELDKSYVNLSALGRLCHQKGYDLMLKAFAEACARRDDLRLYLLGDGPERRQLEKLAQNLNVKDKVFFLGNQPNPYCCLKEMDGLVSTSRYEGQPLNLMEARVVGLPLYCTKNLEQYSEGLRGYEDIAGAIASAEKTEKRPDDLQVYNREILDRIAALAE